MSPSQSFTSPSAFSGLQHRLTQSGIVQTMSSNRAIFNDPDPDDDWPKSSGYPIDGDGEPETPEDLKNLQNPQTPPEK